LITHRFPLDRTAAAVQMAANPRPDSLKIIVSEGVPAIEKASV